jgi:hypothetical protein
VELFLEESPRILRELSDATTARDAAAATAPMAARVTAERLERAGIDGDWHALDAGLPVLRDDLEQLSHVLAEVTPVGV